MTQETVSDKVIQILRTHARNEEAITGISMTTTILDELEVNSARLVDVVLELEETFEVEIDDEEIDRVETVGDAINLILAKAA